MTILNLDEANKRIEELEGKLAHALEVGGARGRLLAEAEAERNLLREQTRGRGEIIEVLTREVASTRAMLRDAMQETESYGFAKVRAEQQELGDKVRALLAKKGFKSVAAEGFLAPGVVVSYTDDAGIQSGKKFLGLGLQTAAGVPLQCDEPADFQSFRIGLFGLDKLHNVERTVGNLERALNQMGL